MSHGYYTLGEDGKTPIPCSQGEWLIDRAKSDCGDFFISKKLSDPSKCKVVTMFTGFNTAVYDPPCVWATFVFGGPLDGEGQYYRSLAEAKIGHEAMVERVKAAYA